MRVLIDVGVTVLIDVGVYQCGSGCGRMSVVVDVAMCVLVDVAMRVVVDVVI